MLLVEISSIRETNGASLHADLCCSGAALGALRGDVEYSGPVQVTVDVMNAGSHILVNGNVEAPMTAPCSRCLELAAFTVKASLSDQYRASSDDDGPETADGDDDSRPMSGDKVDLTDAVRDAVTMATPMRVLCSENCAGLCQICGCNLNEVQCECAPPLDPRLSALAKLLQPEGSDE